ncbi:MAG TPA: hypothetical protein VFP91_02375 [Vicinamibacterales bacterium]|nr:hypothetical protein [Vicinamibacterales bacterium]
MSGFSPFWLALREPADAAARSSRLVSFVARIGRIVDLGGGTGANIRYLSSKLPSPQDWTLVDDDRALLDRAPEDVTRICADLNRVVDDAELFRGCALVTGSALLDLVSDTWLQRLVHRCQTAEAAVLFALSYDGRIVCNPGEPEDEDVRQLVNRHQRMDKGFGTALGPDAATRVVDLLSAAQYELRYERSDWTLGAEFSSLQRQLIDAWVAAASEMAPERRSQIAGWRRRRLDHVNTGRSRIVVGHMDVAGIRRA